MHSSEIPFKVHWAKVLWPVLKDDYERLVKVVPKRVAERAEKEKKDKEKPEAKKVPKAKDHVREKLARCVQEAMEKGERRNCFLNLAWTPPCDNTLLGENISLGKVENVAADLFLKHLPTDGATDTAQEPHEAGDDVEGAPQSKPQRRAAEIVRARKDTNWNIPTSVEKGFEIPIMVSNVNETVMPELGKFKRLAMDVVVNAAWLALFWAKQEGSKEAVTALEALILDWPFDFIHIKGSTPEEIEENKFKWAVNLSARTERLREFTGLENSNLLRIVAKAQAIVKSHMPGGGQPSPEQVQTWLLKNVNWGLHHCPDVNTVKRHLNNWAALAKNPTAMTLIETSVTRWGRDNLLDWPTKLAAIVSKTEPSSLCYVVEALFTRMWRKNNKDPYAAGNALNAAISEIIWVRHYVYSFLRLYPDLFKTGRSCNSQESNNTQGTLSEANSLQTARSHLDSPLNFFLQTEGPDKDPTWIQSLPNDALRLAMRHFLELGQGLYHMEIAGALSQPKGERYNLDKFHKGTRVAKRFFEQFQIHYDTLTAAHRPVEAETKADKDPEADGAATADKKGAATAEKKKQEEVNQSDVTTFRQRCQAACEQELEKRTVLVVAEGTDVEIYQNLTQTRFYKNLTDSASLMGFYDVKNARMCNVFEGQPLTHREPAVDEADFERYLKSLNPMLVAGRDVLWVLTGRAESNLPKMKRLLNKHLYNHRQFHLCYNTKQMHLYGHFTRQRGFANSRSHEVLLLCYKGKIPKHLPKIREHVDAGTNVWCEVVKNVPVLHQKNHALVSKQIREQSLQSMIGTCITEMEAKERQADGQPAPENPDEDDAADTAAGDAATAGPPEKKLVDAALRKRKLFRQLTGTEVPWYPHDNDIELLKELCHEAGGPRWVYFGTPAGGAGMHGCIEKGCSVLALCYDAHHRDHLAPFLVERAVEAMLSSTTKVFHNDDLLKRSVQLRLTRNADDKKDEEKDGDDKKDDKKDNKKDGDDKKDDKKEKKKKGTPSKKIKKSAKKTKKEASSSSSDSSSSDSDGAPKKKKAKTEKD